MKFRFYLQSCTNTIKLASYKYDKKLLKTSSQFWFKDNLGTINCIFVLHTILQNIINTKSKLYFVFIDYKQAFDTAIHGGLWIILVQAGISCKMLKMINISECKIMC